MKCTFLLLSVFFLITKINAQQFIDKAVIEYEVKTNVKKTIPDDMWGEMMKENIPTFKTGYYNFTFANGQSIYKFNHWDEKNKLPEYLRKNDEDNVWYFNFNTNKFNMQKNVFGSVFNVEDSVPVIQWRLVNESRVIAGFNCRKAVGKIMDSVYIFAFYTDEITLSGGPCSINGLPGMILGLTIPRMYTSFIATKVVVNNIDVATIKPVESKKYLTQIALKTTLKQRSKEWIREDDTEDEKKWINQFFWNIYL
jgi:GLPGLI family protein